MHVSDVVVHGEYLFEVGFVGKNVIIQVNI